MDYLMTSPEVFGETFTAAREAEPLIADATSAWDGDVDGTRYYLADGKASGFAVRADGELVFVFSLVRGRGDDLVDCAVQAGATHLDCFDGHLVTLYARHGFAEAAREPNWTPGGPDVVWMSQPGHYSDALDKAYGPSDN